MRVRRRIHLFRLALVGAAGVLLSACSAAPAAPARLDERIVESSGMVASRRHTGVLWHHSDSETAPILYATREDGSMLRSYAVRATNVDWEDIATDDAGHLFVGDIGDNRELRKDLVIYVLDEPDPRERGGPGELAVREAVPFRYPGEGEVAHDAESLFWWRGRLFLLTKSWRERETILFRFPEALGGRGADDRDPVILEEISRFALGGPTLFGGMATAADASVDGGYLAMLTYHAIYLFRLTAEQPDLLAEPVEEIALDMAVTRQCESIAWVGEALVLTNEEGRMFRVDDPLGYAGPRFPASP